MEADDSNAGDGTLGRIALKQVRVTRAEVEARHREANPAPARPAPVSNPMNRLVPYLDLFCRLADEDLSRLAQVPATAVESLRQQVDEVNRALERYVDLLPRLSDDELARLTGASSKTIRFWRLSQPRHLQGESKRGGTDTPPTGPHPTTASHSSQSSSSMSRDALSDSASEQTGDVVDPSDSTVSRF